MKQLTLLILILFPGLLSINSFSQQVISSAGTHVMGTEVQLSWTIGETVIETLTGTSSILTQGFHQSRLTITSIDPISFPNILLTVYPNPVSTSMKLDGSAGKQDVLFCNLYDATGKIILIRKVESLPELINMEPFPAGIYFLKVRLETDQPIKTFKIINN